MQLYRRCKVCNKPSDTVKFTKIVANGKTYLKAKCNKCTYAASKLCKKRHPPIVLIKKKEGMSYKESIREKFRLYFKENK